MTVIKCRKKPVSTETIEAFRWAGGEDRIEEPLWMLEALCSSQVQIMNKSALIIRIPTKFVLVTPGDYILRFPDGELLPCKPDEFRENYCEVEEEVEK